MTYTIIHAPGRDSFNCKWHTHNNLKDSGLWKFSNAISYIYQTTVYTIQFLFIGV